MSKQSKLFGEKRREHLLQKLRQTQQPLKGTELARQTGVSRQVIVQDMALMKAANEPIVATPQGYMYVHKNSSSMIQKVIACQHSPEETETELTILVDHGVQVIDVIVEHAFYGQIQGSLMLNSRADVQQFVQQWQNSEAKLLSVLTQGVHLHTLQCTDEQRIDLACQELDKRGILLKEEG